MGIEAELKRVGFLFAPCLEARGHVYPMMGQVIAVIQPAMTTIRTVADCGQQVGRIVRMHGNSRSVLGVQAVRPVWPRAAAVLADVHRVGGISVHMWRRGRTRCELMDVLVERWSDRFPSSAAILRSHDAAHMNVGVHGAAAGAPCEASHRRRTTRGRVSLFAAGKLIEGFNEVSAAAFLAEFVQMGALGANECAQRHQAEDQQSGNRLVQPKSKIAMLGASVYDNVIVDGDQAKMGMLGKCSNGADRFDFHGVRLTGRR